MRHKKLFIAAAFALAALPAFADQANMEKAINAAFKSYHDGGVEGMYQDARLCTTGVDFGSRTKSPAKQAEYCGAFEYTGFVILDHYNQLKDAGYFESVGVLYRADANLERAGIINSPQQLNDYFASHFGYVRKKVLARLSASSAPAPAAAPTNSASSTPANASASEPIVRASVHAETRCGWISNTMPSSLEISDRDGTWGIATFTAQADGLDKMPGTDKGDTCGCVYGTTDKATHKFTRITGGKILKASVCSADKSLKLPG